MAVQAGWRSIPNWLKDAQFVAAMKAQANGAAVWATFKPMATNRVKGTAHLKLTMSVVRAMANGAATWARWPAGSPQVPRTNSTLQLNAATAIAANFV